MALDSHYILASDLQEYFVDKDTGNPLANGTITFYSDVNRTTLKPVYQLSGSPPNYSYTQLPNPLPLTGVGTISDGAGNDIVPYYYPYDAAGNVELYYIVVQSAGLALQFTREAWPNVVAASSTSQNLTNYVPNGQFRIHNNVPKTDTTVAGQITQAITHLAQGGWTFERPNASTATDIVLFNVFGSAVTNPTGYPRFSVEIINQVPNAGDGYKDLRLKFDDVNKFASTTQQYTFAFSGQSNTGGSITASLILIKNFGTPNGSATQETALATFTISPSYTISQKSFVFGTNEMYSIGSNNDDYLQLALRFPVASVFDVSLTDFVLTPGAVAVSQFPTTPDNDFRYKGIAGWMPTPNPDGSDLYLPLRLSPSGLAFDDTEVGKIYSTSYTTAGIGELLCDGTQYETAAYSTDGIPYSRLQAKLFNGVYPIWGTGLNYLSALFTDLNNPNNNQMMVYTNMADAVSDTADGTPATGFTFNKLSTGINSYNAKGLFLGTGNFYIQCNQVGLATATIGPGTSGFTVNVVFNGPLQRSVVLVQALAATGLAGTYFQFSNVATQVYVWFTVDGAGADPAPGGTGIRVNLFSTFSANSVALAICAAISGYQNTLITVTGAGSTVPAGAYFSIFTFTTPYYVWYTLDGAGTDPKPTGKTAIPVAILSTDTAAQVASKTLLAINTKYFAVPDLRGMFLRGWDHGAGIDPETTLRYSSYMAVINDAIGTFQLDNIHEHLHMTYTNPSGAGGGAAINVVVGAPGSGNDTSYTGDIESRPINAYVNYVIKY